jgi:hypothetical protein
MTEGRVFSSRVPPLLAPNPLALALERERAAGRAILDLTVSNPTSAGLEAPPGLLAALGSDAGASYVPEPFGMPRAREVVAAVLGRRRARPAAVERVALTASTSDAYSALFKLLCDAGDEILVPRPSYPLFEHLAALDAVTARPYLLDAHGAWGLDLATLDAAWSPRCRAVVVVSPNNPTGSRLSREDWRRLFEWCARRRLAVIADEVFRWYPLAGTADAASALDEAGPPALTFALDGLSKSCGLPQVKLGWVEMDGPAPLVDAARRRLEVILDTYLSVSTPVQVALPALLRGGEALRGAIHARLRENLERARTMLPSAPACSLLEPQGGWSAVIRIPSTIPEEARVLALLRDEGVLVHPGYFFDFPYEAFLVSSLLPPPAVFAEGLAAVTRHCAIA